MKKSWSPSTIVVCNGIICAFAIAEMIVDRTQDYELRVALDEEMFQYYKRL